MNGRGAVAVTARLLTVVGTRRRLAGYLLLVVVPAVVAALLVLAFSRPGAATGSAAPVADAAAVPYRLLIAVPVILATAAFCGALLARLGQPAVIGEMTAGIALGPSVLGALAPGAASWLFPAEIMPYLDFLAQLGVVFFMFLVGFEVPLRALRTSGSTAFAVGHAAVAVPFLAGVLTALAMRERYQPTGVGTVPFLLFVALSFSITAFPVLARVLSEQRLLNTPIGSLGITAAGISDVTAWCLLAAVTAAVRNASMPRAAIVVILVVLFGLVMMFVVRPLLARLLRLADAGEHRAGVMSLLVCLVLAAALATEWIGVHAIFGAFLAGLVMPRESVTAQEFSRKIEGLTVWLMLPIFFAVVGLKTSLGSLDSGQAWLWCALVVFVAVTSKTISSFTAARSSGIARREAFGLGLMMNCRGLTELVVLNIGLTLGVLTPELFTIFLVMALLTTAATSPLLRRLHLTPEPVATASPDETSARADFIQREGRVMR